MTSNSKKNTRYQFSHLTAFFIAENQIFSANYCISHRETPGRNIIFCFTFNATRKYWTYHQLIIRNRKTKHRKYNDLKKADKRPKMIYETLHEKKIQVQNKNPTKHRDYTEVLQKGRQSPLIIDTCRTVDLSYCTDNSLIYVGNFTGSRQNIIEFIIYWIFMLIDMIVLYILHIKIRYC